MKRDLAYLTVIAALVMGAAHSQQGSLPRTYTANIEARAVPQGMSGSVAPPASLVKTDFPAGAWVVANKISGRYHFGKTTEVWFASAGAAEAAGYRLSASRPRGASGVQASSSGTAMR
jgi:hypothetical protein